MAGFWQGIVEENGVKDVEVELTRLLAKIEFTYSMGGEGFTFTPTSVTLCSVPQKMQVDAPESQLKEMSYITYTGEVDEQGTTMYWYLPENMAGTVSDEYTVDSEKKKTGQGVSDATFIKLTGTAVQSGVTYENVTFCFYPGKDKNNYDIVRNSYYKMNVTLVGIDISDERITVGKIPPIVVTGGNMPAEKGGRTEVQITARPGQEWSFELEDWLSAIVEGKVVGTGVGVSFQGPANVVFEALSSNPKVEDRSVSFSVDVNGQPQEITLTQAGSTLTTGGDLSLGAAAGSEASSYFTATKGLSWLAAVSGENWWEWSGDNQGGADKETTGEQQALNVKAISSNPLAEERTGTVTVKVGASVGDPNYHNLTKEITVRQAASTVKGSTVELEPVAATGQSSFTATSGLPWAAKVMSDDWITLTGTTGGDQTTGSAQMITFDVKVNPNASQRSGAITVRAGEEDGGPTGTITVKQKASEFTVSKSVIDLPYVASYGSVTVNGTSGLPWTVQPSETTNGITPAITSSTTNGTEQTLTFNATENKGGARSATFTIAVTGGNHSKTVEVKQVAGSAIIVTIDQSVLTNVKPAAGSRLLFDEDGINQYHGCTVDEDAGTMVGSYDIQVQKVETTDFFTYTAVKEYCGNLKEDGLSGWRVPTLIELWAMRMNRDRIVSSTGANTFHGWHYWSSSTIMIEGMEYRSLLYFDGGKFSQCDIIDHDEYIRCVRDI